MRTLPKDNLAYPVLVVLDTGIMGTGFIVNSSDASYFATAKHVFFDEKNNLKGKAATLRSYTSDLVESDYTQISLDLIALKKTGNIIPHITHDICLVKLLTPNSPETVNTIVGVVFNNISSKGILGINVDTSSKLFNDILISNDVFIFGYPSSIGLKNSPQFNSAMPLLRKGIIAGKNIPNSTIILDCPVYQGNSGGPVIEIEQKADGFHYNFIGLVSQFIPVEDRWENRSYGITNIQLANSGYSVVIPTDFLKELLVQFTTTAQSKIP